MAEKSRNDKGKIASLVRFYGRCYRIIAAVVAAVGLADKLLSKFKKTKN